MPGQNANVGNTPRAAIVLALPKPPASTPTEDNWSARMVEKAPAATIGLAPNHQQQPPQLNSRSMVVVFVNGFGADTSATEFVDAIARAGCKVIHRADENK
jgi:hypothetical protein